MLNRSDVLYLTDFSMLRRLADELMYERFMSHLQIHKQPNPIFYQTKKLPHLTKYHQLRFLVVLIPSALFLACCFCLPLLFLLASWSCLDKSGS